MRTTKQHLRKLRKTRAARSAYEKVRNLFRHNGGILIEVGKKPPESMKMPIFRKQEGNEFYPFAKRR